MKFRHLQGKQSLPQASKLWITTFSCLTREEIFLSLIRLAFLRALILYVSNLEVLLFRHILRFCSFYNTDVKVIFIVDTLSKKRRKKKGTTAASKPRSCFNLNFFGHLSHQLREVRWGSRWYCTGNHCSSPSRLRWPPTLAKPPPSSLFQKFINHHLYMKHSGWQTLTTEAAAW